MDLRKIVDRILSCTANNAVYTFEQGRTVRRTFAELHGDILAASARLAQAGVKPGMRVGIQAPNCWDWIVHDLALIQLGAVSIAFTADFARWRTKDLIEKYDLAMLLVGIDKPANDSAPHVYRFGTDNCSVRARPDVNVAVDPEYRRPGLIFSSGSSGGLKGLVLNRLGIEACVDAFTLAVRPQRDDRLLLFLPISNFQQRLMYYSALWYGFDLVVVEPVHLFRALQELMPTILIAPPAFYETFETRFYNLPSRKQRLARALARMIGWLPSAAFRRKLAQRVFGPAHQALGGKIRFMVTGMAPIRRSALELFLMMQLPVFETYGLIESGSVSLNLPGANRLGSVGRLLPGVRVELASDGEILVYREHPIAVSYFESAEGESERTFLGDAVATGDIGRFDEDGYLYLVGRKKETIVTSGGEKVHPAVIEADIGGCPDVDRVVVFGRKNSATLAAILLPKQPSDAAAKARISQFVEHLNQQRWRNVTVDKIIFTEQTFSLDNGFLRPNLKLDRTRIAEHFAAAIG